MTNTSLQKLLHPYCVGVLLLAGLLTSTVQAQTFQVIHTFNGADGANPMSGLTMDRAGNLYGTTSEGGTSYGGTAYRLKHSGTSWSLNVLHTFTDTPDGIYPESRIIFGPDGALYGTTFLGGRREPCTLQGEQSGCGTVFRLTPRATVCGSTSCPWTEKILYAFQGGIDGAFPAGDLTFDSRGNIYGATSFGGVLTGLCLPQAVGPYGCGAVYELSPSQGGWTQTTVYAFLGPEDNYADGVNPASGVTLDGAGNLYGTAGKGGAGGYNGFGVVYKLVRSGERWGHEVLHSFTGGDDGYNPAGGLILDQAGNLYGTTSDGGTGGGGTVFELIPTNGSWILNTLYSFSGSAGCGPNQALALDSAGNLYGTIACDGAHGFGSVFKLTPTPTPPWTYTSLHDFTNGPDGSYPSSNVVLDAGGDLFGTTTYGGPNPCYPFGGFGCGVVWEITP